MDDMEYTLVFKENGLMVSGFDIDCVDCSLHYTNQKDHCLCMDFHTVLSFMTFLGVVGYDLSRYYIQSLF